MPEKGTREALARDITALREGLRWTQDELARRLQVSGATVSRWEAGLSIPRPEHLNRLYELGKTKGGPAAVFLARYQNLREQEQIARSLQRTAGVIETHRIGEHTVELLEDGGLLVNGTIRIGA
jgi:transcriptional regulator with XRE-family HTH domain